MIDQVQQITDILKTGGGYAMAAVFIILYVWEKKERQKLQKVVIQLAVAAERARSATANSVGSLRNLLEAIQKKIME